MAYNHYIMVGTLYGYSPYGLLYNGYLIITTSPPRLNPTAPYYTPHTHTPLYPMYPTPHPITR